MDYRDFQNPLRADRREPRHARYIDLPPEQWDRAWMVSLIQQLDCILEYGLVHEIQTLADRLDYGNTLSPREVAAFAPVAEAFSRAVLESAAKCAKGEHQFIPGDPRCRSCRTPRFTVVERDP